MTKNESLWLKSGQEGENKARALNLAVEFTRIEVGDANGTTPVLDVNLTQLINKVQDGNLISHQVDLNDKNQRIINMAIPPTANFNAVEVLLYAKYGNTEFPHTYFKLASPFAARTIENGGSQAELKYTVRTSEYTDFTVSVVPEFSYVTNIALKENNAQIAKDYQGLQNGSIPAPKGAVFNTQASQLTGPIKIKLPQSWSSTMLGFNVNVYEFNTDHSFQLAVSGYNYRNSSSWLNCSAFVSSGSRTYKVRFGHDGDTCCVYIGEDNESWRFVQLNITDLVTGYSSYEASLWDENWSISVGGQLAENITSTLIADAPYSAENKPNAEDIGALSTKGGVLDNGDNTTLTIKSNDNGMSKLELLGDNQGTGLIYLGQSTQVGGGIAYNGDASPSTQTGQDFLTLYRTIGGARHWTARNSVENNHWIFRDNIYAKGGKEVYHEGSSEVAKQVFKTSNTTNQLNKWTKIGTVTLPFRYNGATAVLQTISTYEGSGEIYHETLEIGIKQQNPFGNDPKVFLKQSRTGDTNYQFCYQIVKNTPTTTVDLFIRLTEGYSCCQGWVVNQGGNELITFLSEQPFLDDLPSGAVLAEKIHLYSDENKPTPTAIGALPTDGTGIIRKNSNGDILRLEASPDSENDISLYMGNSGSGYRFTYHGTGAGNLNDLTLSYSNKTLFRSHLDGIVNFPEGLKLKDQTVATQADVDTQTGTFEVAQNETAKTKGTLHIFTKHAALKIPEDSGNKFEFIVDDTVDLTAGECQLLAPTGKQIYLGKVLADKFNIKDVGVIYTVYKNHTGIWKVLV
ncbi:phage tail protein [Pseudoalteromonas denitrificans]|uniref:phage tail-collar fiber domain-containing protein n=1 Tax=Pseudoalteromonas denitrificans TaxID=43656 RepID=UPI0015A57352|nr:phage tail protein [Pseudoalteromonas denitrificans]